MTGLAGVLLAKCAAAHSRRKPKDWNDIAYVLIHKRAGGVEEAARAVVDRVGTDLRSMTTALDDLADNFADPDAQGTQAYADEMHLNHPQLDHRRLRADGTTAVMTFVEIVRARR